MVRAINFQPKWAVHRPDVLFLSTFTLAHREIFMACPIEMAADDTSVGSTPQAVNESGSTCCVHRAFRPGHPLLPALADR